MTRFLLILSILSLSLGMSCRNNKDTGQSLALTDGEPLALVKAGGKWGYIDKTGSIVIRPQFENACRFSE